MNNKFSTLLILLSIAAAVAGGLVGYFLPNAMVSISFIGKLFLSALKIIVIPFVIALVISGIAQMKDSGKVKRIYGKTIGYFLSTSFLASLFGAVIALILQPGVGAVKDGASFPEEIIPELSSFSFNQLFSSILPENILNASAEMQVFGLLLLSVLIGLVLTKADKKNKVVLDFFSSFSETMSKAMQYLIYAAPVGIFSLTGTLFAVYGEDTSYFFSSMMLYSVILFLSFSFFVFVILPVIMRIFTPYSPYKYFSKMIPALTTAFATNSQMATVPITTESISEEIADGRAAAFVIPLGAMFNANGTALFLSFSAMFIAQMYGLSISVFQVAGLIGASLVVSFFAAFIPYASLFILALVMQIAGFPIHVTAAIGIIVLVDFIFSRVRTVVNVWGDAVGTAVIGSSFDFKTARNAQVAKKTSRTYTKSKSAGSKPPYKKTYDNKDKDSSVKPKRGYRDKDKAKTTKTKSKTPRVSTKKQASSKPSPKAPVRKDEPKKEAVRSQSPFVMPPVPYHVLETELKPRNNNNVTAAKPEKAAPKVTKQEARPSAPKVEVTKNKKEPSTPVIKPESSKIVQETITDSSKDDSLATKTNNILSQDTIERERKKIAAQLNSMRDREVTLDKKVKADISESESRVSEPTTSYEKSDFTTIDFVSEEPIKTESRTDTLTEKEPTVDLPEVKQKNTMTEPSFSPPAAESEQVKEDIKEAVPVKESPPATFGRTKQRKGPKPSSSKKTEQPEEKPEEKSVEQDYTVDKMSFGRSKRKK